eukprot:1158159-Pelagomonas_calceolata.AAC.2
MRSTRPPCRPRASKVFGTMVEPVCRQGENAYSIQFLDLKSTNTSAAEMHLSPFTWDLGRSKEILSSRPYIREGCKKGSCGAGWVKLKPVNFERPCMGTFEASLKPAFQQTSNGRLP